MGQELQLPDWAKKGQAQAFAGLAPQADNLAEGIGQSYGVIGYKGKVWSLRSRGERHNIIRPDDGTPSAYIDVIILGSPPNKSKSFYKKFDAATSEGDRPICASIDGVVPDADVTQKQSDSCALCPRNVWKTDAQTGRKGRECTDYKRLAVLILPTQTTPILGSPLMEPVFLRVPPDSLNSLAIMGEGMATQGFHYSSYITRITFDPNKAHPCMVFRPLQGLTDGEAPVILDLRKDPIVGRITGGEVAIQGPKIVEAPLNMAALGQIASGQGQASQGVGGNLLAQSGPQTPTDQGTSSTPGIYSSGFGVVQVATPSTPPNGQSTSSTTATDTAVADTGFGGVTNAINANADAGEPEDSDAALDARIAALIRK